MRAARSLQRGGLFDFVSPFSVFLAVSGYLLFAAFVIHIQHHPFLGFAGLINLGAITLVYALNAFVVYTMLYGRNRNPFETHAGRPRTIGLTVKSSVCSCIVIVVYLSLNFSLRPAGHEEMGTVRAEYFFRHLRASRFHGLRRTTAQARGG